MGKVLRLLALLPPLLAAVAARPAHAEERFALLVGSNAGGPGAAPLYFAELDAERMGDVLVELGGVPRDHLVVLRSPSAPGLEAALQRLADRVALARLLASGPATVFFYYSGHAGPDALQLGQQEVPFAALRRALEATGAGVRLVFVDSCHAGGATRSKGARRAPGFLEAAVHADAMGEVVITSSAEDELSQESDDVGGSWFTHFLLSGLRGAADESLDGVVTLEEAYRYVYHRTVAHTAGTRAGTQHPGFDYDLSGSGDLVLTRLSVRGAQLSFGEALSGRFLVFDDDRDRFVAEVQAVPGRPTRLSVEAGTWRVQRREPDALYEQVLVLGPGAEGDVDPGRMVAVPYSEDTAKGAVARTRREAQGREVAVSGRLGVQAFYDEPTRTTLVPPMPLLGLEIDLRGLLHPRLSLRLDAMLGAMEHEPFPGTRARVGEADLGVGVFWVPRVPGTGAARPFAGVRIGALLVHRDFLPPLVQEEQIGLMGAPGLALGIAFAPDRHLRLSIEARSHLSLYLDDAGEQLVRGGFEAVIGIGGAP